jgi:hypothetical protein
MSCGRLGCVVPLSIYAPGYKCNPNLPLPFINLASQKNYISLCHRALYKGPLFEWFKREWESSSWKKLDMGKCCIRFKTPEDVPLDLIGRLVSKVTPQQRITMNEGCIMRK